MCSGLKQRARWRERVIREAGRSPKTRIDR